MYIYICIYIYIHCISIDSHPQIDGKVNPHQVDADLLVNLFGDDKNTLNDVYDGVLYKHQSPRGLDTYKYTHTRRA